MSDKFQAYTQTRSTHWDDIAANHSSLNAFSGYYHSRLTEIMCWNIGKGKRVLEIGCGYGDLLAALNPKIGVGIDFSSIMIEKAQTRHPEIQFFKMDAHEISFDQTFDWIILSDLINDVWDLQTVLSQVKKLSSPKTRVVLNFFNRIYQPAISLASKLEQAKHLLPQNWFTPEDVKNLLYLSGFDVISHQREILLPIRFPILDPLANKFLVKIGPISHLAWTNLVIARPLFDTTLQEESVSIIIPARNEAGNIQNALNRLPKFGKNQEVIFVEGNSSDDTFTVIENLISDYPHLNPKLYKQPGKGKADAVRVGFEKANGDILMILDADLTVQPEDLPRFYEVLIQNRGEFVNGVRLVYPMHEQAMRFLNLIGNKFFSFSFSWLLGQPIRDTLCGTKVLRRENYKEIENNREYFGDFDPFGDYDLIFGAAKLHLKIVDLPIRYQDRTYGTTNIDRWRHGALLFKMLFFAAKRLKFT